MKVSKFIPNGDRILIKILNETKEEKRESGIILMRETVENEQTTKAVIIAVGAEVKDKDFFAVGSVVMVKNFAMDLVEIGGERFHVMNTSIVLGKYELESEEEEMEGC